jgi:hypothetical protein
VVFQPRPEAKPEDEDFVSDEGGPAVLNPKAPLEMTKKFMRRHCIVRGRDSALVKIVWRRWNGWLTRPLAIGHWPTSGAATLFAY